MRKWSVTASASIAVLLFGGVGLALSPPTPQAIGTIMPPKQELTALASNRLAMLPPGSHAPRLGADARTVDYLVQARRLLLDGDPVEAEHDLEWVQLSERADAFYAGCTIPALDPHCLGPICKALYGIGMGDTGTAMHLIDNEIGLQEHYLNGEPRCAPIDRQSLGVNVTSAQPVNGSFQAMSTPAATR